jgi:hypothetical protein
MLKLTIGISFIFGAFGSTCQTVCDSLSGCETSSCRVLEDPPVCSGLFYRDATLTEICIEGTEGCSYNWPVVCPVETNVCDVICASTDFCSSRGSYCKYWQTIPVCYGLYYSDESRSSTCFHRGGGPDDSCPEQFPVGCHSGTHLSVGEEASAEAETTSTEPVIQGPYGVYYGETGNSDLRVTARATFNPELRTLQATFTLEARDQETGEFSAPMIMQGSDIPYVMNGEENVEVQDCEGIQAILARLPRLTLSHVRIL